MLQAIMNLHNTKYVILYTRADPIPELQKRLTTYVNSRNRDTLKIEEFVIKRRFTDTEAEQAYKVLDETRAEGSDYTALHIAVMRGHKSELKVLLRFIKEERKYELLGERNANGTTPLHEAIRLGHTEAVMYIYNLVAGEHGYQLLTKEDKDGNTPLHYVALYGGKEDVMHICKSVTAAQRYELLRIQNKNGQTPLHSAAERGHTELISHILDSVTTKQMFQLLTTQTVSGHTLLRYAASWKALAYYTLCSQRAKTFVVLSCVTLLLWWWWC